MLNLILNQLYSILHHRVGIGTCSQPALPPGTPTACRRVLSWKVALGQGWSPSTQRHVGLGHSAPHGQETWAGLHCCVRHSQNPMRVPDGV